MACFIAPATVGIVTTVFRKRIPEKYHIKWLNMLIGGGTAGLALEHLSSGEITPFFPFLTAMKSPAETALMLQELSTIGVAMLFVCIAIWAVMVCVASVMEAGSATKAGQVA
jgi:hypothetical protein